MRTIAIVGDNQLNRALTINKEGQVRFPDTGFVASGNELLGVAKVVVDMARRGKPEALAKALDYPEVVIKLTRDEIVERIKGR